MVENARTTGKINSALDQTSSWIKFLLQIIAAIGVVSGILLYPLLTKVANVENSITDLKKTIETKVDEKIYQNTMDNIRKSWDEMKTDIKWLVRRNDRP